MKISYHIDLDRLRKILTKNPNSPLFARYAEQLMKKGLINEAMTICENGIKRHKFYSTGYIVLARIYLSKGREKEAGELLNKVLKLNPFCYTARVLLDKIQSKKFTERIKREETAEKEKVKWLQKYSQKQKEDIEEILEKLNNAESLIIRADPNFDKYYEPPSDIPEVVTETMYHILINQRLYKKAYELLLKLIDKNPSRRQYYLQQLEWIKTKIAES